MNSKKFIAMLCAFACMISVSSCGLVQSSEDDDAAETTAAETTAAETTTAAEGESTDTATETTTAETTTATETTTTATADWTSFSFTYDGADVQLPLTITEFETATGSGVLWENYGEGFWGTGSKMSDETKRALSQYCDLTYSDGTEYDYNVNYQVYLNSDDDTALKDAPVTGFDFSIIYVKDGTLYPSVELPGGITWGSTADEIKAAYGEPFYETTSTTDSMGDIQEMKYSGNKGSSLTLYVYAEGGLKRMIESAGV